MCRRPPGTTGADTLCPDRTVFRSGNGNGGDAYAGGGTGGDGGRGGDGGTASANAGSFDMSNAMNGSSNAAAGIMMVAQNSGASSLIQQGVTVQANLNVG